MEKADILEMTVAYLQTIYRCRQSTVPVAGTSDSAGGGRYAAGYRQCAVEVARYLAGVASTDCTLDVVQLKLMRHLTAVLQTKLHRQPDDDDDDDDDDKLFPAMTSLPLKLEVVTRSCDSSDSSSCVGRERTCSRASSETGIDMDHASSVSPTSSDPVDPAVSPSSASTSPPYRRDRAMECQSSADRTAASNASVADADLDLDLLRAVARSADSCVWRPW